MADVIMVGGRSLIRSPNYEKDVPPHYQLALLGLDETALTSLKGKRVLDLACGNGALVEHMRERGIEAYGVDPRAPSRDYFASRPVSGKGREHGFPVADESLDLLVSFQNVPFNIVMTDVGIAWFRRNFLVDQSYAWERVRLHRRTARHMLTEMGRTLRPEAKALIYPDFQYADKGHTPRLLQASRLEIERVPVVDQESVAAYYRWERDPISRYKVSRTELTKR